MARGVGELFSHQAAAVEVLRGQQQQQQQHCVIATSTASGKSLCYYIPVLEALAHNREVRLAGLSTIWGVVNPGVAVTPGDMCCCCSACHGSRTHML
jgi:superfamily II DNA helicase RecQ